MSGGFSYKILDVKKISYKDYYILVEKRLRYPIKSNKIFYDITANTKEVVKYEEVAHKFGYGSKEFNELKDPNYDSKTDTHKHTYLWEKDLDSFYTRWKTMKTQKDINERIKLFKKKIDERRKKNGT